jgi:hypothetical protein
LLSVIGVATVGVCLLNDLPKGLDEGDSALAYEGARATLLAPFWAQLVSGGVLVGCGALLAGRLREEAVARSRSSVRRPRAAPTAVVAGEDGAAARESGT